jgi:hypothetical protein
MDTGEKAGTEVQAVFETLQKQNHNPPRHRALPPELQTMFLQTKTAIRHQKGAELPKMEDIKPMRRGKEQARREPKQLAKLDPKQDDEQENKMEDASKEKLKPTQRPKDEKWESVMAAKQRKEDAAKDARAIATAGDRAWNKAQAEGRDIHAKMEARRQAEDAERKRLQLQVGA